MKRILIVLTLGILAASCHHIKEPVFNRIEKVAWGDLSLNKSAITLRMNYFNPNKFSAKLKEAEGDAWMDSAYLGHFTVDSIVVAPAHSEFIIPVNLSVDLKHILQHSLALLLKPEVTIRISGRAKAGRAGIYRNFPLYYEGKQNLADIIK